MTHRMCIAAAVSLGVALGAALGGAVPAAGARVFADGPGDDDRAALPVEAPLARSLALVRPIRDGRPVGPRAVTGFFAEDCRTLVTVAHLRRLAGAGAGAAAGAGAGAGGATVEILFRDRRGAWLRRSTPLGPPARLIAGPGGFAGDFLVLRLARPMPDCAPLALGPAPSAEASVVLAAMQPIGPNGTTAPARAGPCRARPYAPPPEAGVGSGAGPLSPLAHDCDLSLGASGGALLIETPAGPVAVALQTARVAGAGDAAPNRTARDAPNIALGFRRGGPVIAAVARLRREDRPIGAGD